MDVGEIPMILFTTIAQMCVGAFIVLGVIQLLGSLKYSAEVVDTVADPALYAIGPALVLGLAVSMLHMHDITHTFNVIRHFSSSWLSREIVFGMLFAGAGFVFAFLQWRKIGHPRLRQALAGLTALLGVCLIVSMSMIYYSLTTVPAWHHVATPVGFFITALLLGSLLVGAAFMLATLWRRKQSAADQEAVTSLISRALMGLAVTAVVVGGAAMVRLPLYVSDLARQGGAALESANHISPGLFTARLVLLAISTGLMAVIIFFFASQNSRLGPKPLAIATVVAFVLALISELMGRALFYEMMVRVGV